MKLIKIILPTRNRPAFLLQTLHSIMQQDHQYFRLIISDNSDSSILHIIDEFTSDKRVQYYFVGDQNLSALQHEEVFQKHLTSSDYYTIIHDDDILLPNHLSESINCLEQRSDGVRCCYSYPIFIDAYGFAIKSASSHYLKNTSSPRVFQGWFDALLRCSKNPVACPTLVWKDGFIHSESWMRNGNNSYTDYTRVCSTILREGIVISPQTTYKLRLGDYDRDSAGPSKLHCLKLHTRARNMGLRHGCKSHIFGNILCLLIWLYHDFPRLTIISLSNILRDLSYGA